MEYLQYSLGGALAQFAHIVLNLIITGMPSIQYVVDGLKESKTVLNLIITGMPSIHAKSKRQNKSIGVLNLIITGMPSIQGSTNPLRKYLK